MLVSGLAATGVEGEAGLVDRSSAPRRVANRTPADRVAAIVALRQLRMTAAEIAETLAMPLSTVSAMLSRSGMGRLGRIGLEQPVRYERSRPGELVHIDIKKLGRIEGGAGKRVGGRAKGSYRPRRHRSPRRPPRHDGWEFVHIAIDDYSRLAYAEVLPDEKATTAIGFLKRALAFFARHGIQVERILTDNGSAYISTASTHSPAAALGIRHLRTRPRRPQTNGKAERFIRTCSTAGPTARSTAQATNEPKPLTAGSGTTTIARRHSALGHQPPTSRTNLLGADTKSVAGGCSWPASRGCGPVEDQEPSR